MQIYCNGKPLETAAGTLADLLTELQVAGDRVAVERNLVLVPRRLWSATGLEAGDRIEVVQFVGGG